MSTFETWLAATPIVVLDGANGTELERRGLAAPLPLWTGDAAWRAPDLLRAVHDDYLQAGSDIVTANTFRTAPYVLRSVGREADAVALTRDSVAIARAACVAAGHGFVAGNMAPLEDCFHPERTPKDDAVLAREHARHAEAIAASGADLLFVETVATTREARLATRAALATGLPVWVSFLPAPDGNGDLFGGEDLETTVARLLEVAVDGRGVGAILANCAPPRTAHAAIARIHDVGGGHVRTGACPNLGSIGPDGIWSSAGVTPSAFAAWANDARRAGARILGGCCGSQPAHIAALAAAVRTT